MQAAQTVHWRLNIAKTTIQPKTIWKINRWVRLKSFLKPETATILPLDCTENDTPIIHTYTEKTTLLTERFFPNLNTDISDIANQNFERKQGQ